MDINRNLPKLFESHLNGLRAASETAHRGERKEKQSRQRMYIWVFFTFSFFRGGAGGAKKAQKLSSRELKVQSGKEDEKRRNNDLRSCVFGLGTAGCGGPFIKLFFPELSLHDF